MPHAHRRSTIRLEQNPSFAEHDSMGRGTVLKSRSLPCLAIGTLLTVAPALALTACGDSSRRASTAAASKPLIETGRPPLITGLAIDPTDHSILLATNVGLYRIDSDGKAVRPIEAHAAESGADGPFGERVSSLAFAAPHRLLGSGHPNRVVDRLPPFLGLLESRDGGRSWKGIARTGFSDLHVLLVAGASVYAFDTTLGGVVVSSDGGRTFAERTAPEGPTVIDMAVDPGDGRYILASTPAAIFASSDQGNSWHRLARATEARLSWSSAGLFRADSDGAVRRSEDRGRNWAAVGKLPGSPGKLVQAGGGELYAALNDARILRSTDGGREWKPVFSP